MNRFTRFATFAPLLPGLALCLVAAPGLSSATPRDARPERVASPCEISEVEADPSIVRPIDLLRALRGEAVSAPRRFDGRERGSAVAVNRGESPRLMAWAGGRPDFSVLADVEDDGLTDGYGIATGDLNADGFGDLVLGSYLTKRTITRESSGAVHVLFGPLEGGGDRRLWNDPPDLTILGRAGSVDWLGASVAVADVSGDGVGDLIAGAPAAERVYVFLGPLGPGLRESREADVVFGGVNLGDLFGYSLGTGDTNADGIADLIVGAPNASTATRNGAAYLFRGPFVRDNLRWAAYADAAVWGREGIGPIGQFVAIGDLTGDGLGDLLVSQTETELETTVEEPPNRQDPAYVVAAPFPPLFQLDLNVGDATVTVIPPAWDDGIGPWLAAGDVTGDGAADFVVAASHGNGPEDSRPDAGEVYVLEGPLAPGRIELASAPPRLTIYGDRPAARLGTSLALADVDADGSLDLVIGSDSPASWGAVNVLLAPLPSSNSLDLAHRRADFHLTGDGRIVLVGASLAAGDVSGDGAADIVYGSWALANLERALIRLGTPAPLENRFPLLDARDLSASSGGDARIIPSNPR